MIYQKKQNRSLDSHGCVAPSLIVVQTEIPTLLPAKDSRDNPKSAGQEFTKPHFYNMALFV